MKVVTFYSYKGGVGRSMALASVAERLAERGKRVLAIDWDLEAPGLEEYFDSYKVQPDGRGLLALLREKENYRDYIWNIESSDGKTKLDLLPSGRDESDYLSRLEDFNYDNFYENGGGDFLEQLRAKWQDDYDFVLVDSRTGLSDAGGVCTIHLPDIVIGMFTSTLQSVRGVRDVLRLALRARRGLAYERAQFPIIPVPCRIGLNDQERKGRWMRRFEEELGDLYLDWVPTGIKPINVLRRLSIDHSPDLLFGAKPNQSSQPIAALADLLEANLRTEFTREVFSDAGNELDASSQDSSPEPRGKRVFLSFPSASLESRWIEGAFLEPFSNAIDVNFGSPVKIDASFEQFRTAGPTPMEPEATTALQQAKAIVIFLSSRSARSDQWAEIDHACRLAEQGKAEVFPVLLSNWDQLPARYDVFKRYVHANFTDFLATSSSMNNNPEFNRQVSKLVDRVSDSLSEDEESTNVFGKYFVSYRRPPARPTGVDEAVALCRALRDRGARVWRDEEDLPKEPLENELVKVLEDRDTAGVIALVTPEVETSPTIKSVEVFRSMRRHQSQDGFLFYPVLIGVDLNQVGNVLQSSTGFYDPRQWNLHRMSGDVLDDDGAIAVARNLIAARLAAIASRKRRDFLEVGLFTRRPPDGGGYALCFDYSPYFDGRRCEDGTYERIERALLDSASALLGRLSGMPLIANGSAPLPLAVLFGAIFTPLAGFRIGWRQPFSHDEPEVWTLKAEPERIELNISTVAGTLESKDVVLAIGVSAHIEQAVSEYVQSIGLKPRVSIHCQPKTGAIFESKPLSPGQGRYFVDEAIATVRRFKDDSGMKRVRLHLFIAGPVAMGMLFGQRLNTFSSCVVYEHDPDQDPSYRSVHEFNPSGYSYS